MSLLSWIWLNSEKLSQLATAASAIAAFAAIVIAAWQITKAKKSQERATALQIYSDFLRFTLDHPEFLDPGLTAKDVVDGTWRGKWEKFAEYEVYIDLMIVAFEELMSTSDHKSDLESYMKSYLIPHKQYFCSERFRAYQEQLSPAFRSFLFGLFANDGIKPEISLPAGRVTA